MPRHRWVQHPITHKMIPVDEVDWDRGSGGSFQIMPDIEPFVSPVDGSVVSSRSALRRHNKRNNVVNTAEFDGVAEAKRAERQAVAEGRHEPTKRERARDIADVVYGRVR